MSGCSRRSARGRGRPSSWPAPWGIEYRVDVLNGFVLVLVSTVGAVIMPFARRSVAFEVEVVVEWNERFVMTEKFGRAGEVHAARDPRS